MIDILNFRVPIIQAPMAGGITIPALVAAVANTDAIGSFGFAYSNAQKINEDLIAAKTLTKNPINANFFIFNPVTLPNEHTQNEALSALNRLPNSENVSLRIPQPPFNLDLEQQLQPIWEHQPAMLTFHLGIPPLVVIQRAHSLDICVGITATNEKEALAIQKAGADFIVAQGIEAGGHRGHFDADDDSDEQHSTTELVTRVAAVSSLPIVAAGGIMNGEDIRTILNHGASAAQMGTAFLCCDEAGTSSTHKHFIMKEHDRETVYTKGFSGRWAQGINNQFIKLMEKEPVLPFPIQNMLTNPVRQFAIKTNNGEYQSLWAGKSYKKARATPVRQLIQQLVDELKLANL